MAATALATDSHGFPAAKVRAIQRTAEAHADLVADELDKLGSVPGADSGGVFPAAFLLELAAILQLLAWERAGLTAHIEAGLPSFDAARHELRDRRQRGHWDTEPVGQTLLFGRVLPFLLNAFAWDGPELLQADVLLNDADDDTELDAIAEFLFANRHTLGQILGDETDA
ncbi:MAG: hypothetical protein KDA75_13665 [Planctomycetaceae bacterium]|nr:hypothetical protein [Planctomycetaceae bacterium]